MEHAPWKMPLQPWMVASKSPSTWTPALTICKLRERRCQKHHLGNGSSRKISQIFVTSEVRDSPSATRSSHSHTVKRSGWFYVGEMPLNLAGYFRKSGVQVKQMSPNVVAWFTIHSPSMWSSNFAPGPKETMRFFISTSQTHSIEYITRSTQSVIIDVQYQ